MATRLFSSWVKGCSWLALSIVAVIGYLSQREWFVNATSTWVVGVFEGACLLIVASVIINKCGEAIVEAYLGLRELGRLHKQKNNRKIK